MTCKACKYWRDSWVDKKGAGLLYGHTLRIGGIRVQHGVCRLDGETRLEDHAVCVQFEKTNAAQRELL